MITETTGGDLNYKSIRFVNWSLPTGVEKEEILCESIRLFISKSIPREAKSVAIAMPDWCEEEEIVANEMIEQTIRRIKSTGLKISFVFQPDQSSFYQHFVNTIEKLRGTEEQFGYFQCSVTSKSERIFPSNDVWGIEVYPFDYSPSMKIISRNVNNESMVISIAPSSK